MEKYLDAVQKANQDLHSIMIVQHGDVLAEKWISEGKEDEPHILNSVSKTFTASAVGLLISEGRLNLTDKVISFFPDKLPANVSEDLKAMTIRDLLTMTCGHDTAPSVNTQATETPAKDWVEQFLAHPVEHKPGTFFAYNSLGIYMLSAIVQKVTGMKVLDYLRMKLFEPMHITDISWEASPEGINTGGWGVYIQSESLAKFGQLLLNRGVWKGKQLLPAWWVDQMMAKQSDTGSFGYGYGYQMWLCEYPGAIRMDGALGQYVLIIPDKDMVVVITECTLIDGATQRRLVWNRLLPAVTGDQPLIAGKDYKRLQKKQSSYQLPLVQGKASSSLVGEYADKSIMLEPNKFGWQSLELHFKQKEVIMTVTETNGTKYDLLFGYKQWKKASIEGYPPYSIEAKGRFNGIEGPFYVAGSYAWPSPSTLELKAHYVNWITALNLTLRFDGENVQLTVKENYSSEGG